MDTLFFAVFVFVFLVLAVAGYVKVNNRGGDFPTEEKPPKQNFDDNPISKTDTEMDDDDGITELIRQQEQTNEHLQKLISDFFWFRIGIIGLLIFGGIFATGGFK